MTNGNPRCGFRTLSTLLVLTLSTVALPAHGKDVAARQPNNGEAGRAYDLRTTLGVAAPALSATQRAAADRLRAEIPGLLVSADERTGGIRTLSNATGSLTGPNGGDAERVAIDYVSDHADLFGLSPEDLRNYEVTNRVPSTASGVTHLYLRQTHAGLAVYNGQLHVNVAADGRVRSVNNQFVSGLAGAVNTTRPAISGDEAVAAFAAHLGVAELGGRPTEPQLMLLPIRPGEVRLVWNFNVDLVSNWYDVTVDAVDGRVWTRFDWGADVNDYRVYQRPVEAPTFVAPLPPADGRTLQTAPANAVASPFGWSLRAIRDNRLRAAAIGLNVDQRLGVIYTISAAMAGAAGALLAQTTGFASLDVLDFHRSADTMLMLVIGGAGWLWGGVLGALAFKVLHDLLSAWTPQYWTFWLGLFLLVLVMVGRDRFFKPWTWFKK